LLLKQLLNAAVHIQEVTLPLEHVTTLKKPTSLAVRYIVYVESSLQWLACMF